MNHSFFDSIINNDEKRKVNILEWMTALDGGPLFFFSFTIVQPVQDPLNKI